MWPVEEVVSEPLFKEISFPAVQESSFFGSKTGMRGTSLITIFQLGKTAPKPMASVQQSIFAAEVLLPFCLLQATNNCWLPVNFCFLMYHQAVVISPFFILAWLNCCLKVLRGSAQNTFIHWQVYNTARTA